VYRKVYRNVIQPEKVAELLILRADMPRSLAACTGRVLANLRDVANHQSDETLRRAGRLESDLRFGRIDEILATGLHAYLTQFLDRVNDLGLGISRDFLVSNEWTAPRPTTSVVRPPRGSSRPAEPDRLETAPRPTTSVVTGWSHEIRQSAVAHPARPSPRGGFPCPSMSR
jgi:hypothetical protein